MIPLGLVVILSYFVGSFPTSIVITKIARGIDIRNHGSGNAGGTNVIRVLVPLVATNDQVDEGLDVLESALAAVGEKKGAVAQLV